MRGYGLTWNGDAMTDMEPSGRTFGRGIGSENEMSVLQSRVSNLGATATKLLDRLSVLREELSDANRRISALEDRMSREDEPLEVWVDRQLEKLAIGVRRTKFETSEDDTRIERILDDHRDRLVKLEGHKVELPPTHHETFKRGAEHGLETAILRVRRYMGGHFSEATIGGVVQAIQAGEDPGLPLVG